MIGLCISMGGSSQWYVPELHNDSRNDHSGHTILGIEACVVPLGLGQLVNSVTILAAISYKKSRWGQNRLFFDWVEVPNCYQSCLLEFMEQSKHCYSLEV